MNEPRWLSETTVLVIHEQLLQEHGGQPGILNPGLLSSAIGKPRNLFYYGGPEITLFDLAAAYGYGLVKNHPFIDGNKRIGLTVIDVFLQLNGYELIASEVEAVAVIRALASSNASQAGEMSQLTQWIQQHSQPCSNES